MFTTRMGGAKEKDVPHADLTAHSSALVPRSHTQVKLKFCISHFTDGYSSSLDCTVIVLC